MDKIYSVYWTQTALDELSGILAYPPEVKERIYLDSFDDGYVIDSTSAAEFFT